MLKGVCVKAVSLYTVLVHRSFLTCWMGTVVNELFLFFVCFHCTVKIQFVEFDVILDGSKIGVQSVGDMVSVFDVLSPCMKSLSATVQR